MLPFIISHHTWGTNTTFESVLIYISPSGASNFLSTLELFDLFFN